MRPVMKSVDLAIKLSHRFDRRATIANESAITLDVVAEL